MFPSSPKTFCSHAWDFVCVSLESANTQVCCKTPIHDVSIRDLEQFGPGVVDNTDEYRQRREALLRGIEHSDCTACWSAEHAGALSLRQKSAVTHLPVYLAALSGSNRSDASEVGAGGDIQSELAGQPRAACVQIKLGNACDLKCIYCCAYYSSMWEAEDEKAGRPTVRARVAPPELQERFSHAFWEWFGGLHGSLREVEFIGGEPTSNPALYEALGKIEEICRRWEHRSAPSIRLVTNLNTPQTHWKRLRRVLESSNLRYQIQISNEAWGRRAEYIRFGLRWERFLSNFADLMTVAAANPRIDVGIMPSLNVLCISSLSEYLEWVHGQSEALHRQCGRRVTVFVNEVQYPVCLSLDVLPSRFAFHLDRAILCMREWPASEGREGDVHALQRGVLENAQNRLLHQETVDPVLSAQFADWIADNDRRRATDCLSVFPEYEDLLSKAPR